MIRTFIGIIITLITITTITQAALAGEGYPDQIQDYDNTYTNTLYEAYLTGLQPDSSEIESKLKKEVPLHHDILKLINDMIAKPTPSKE